MISTHSQGNEAHHTVIFKLQGSMDDAETVLALSKLGVSLSTPLPQGSAILEHPFECRSWMACGLRSDGIIELWSVDSSSSMPSGSLEKSIRASGMPYEIYGE
jgi:hypothetical protein